jgi:hypothetical protein
LTNTKLAGHVTRWLLVFDNVEDPGLLDAYWPKGAHGSIIVTTRNPDVQRYAMSKIELGPFNETESREFLLKLVYNENAEQVDHSNAADQIATTLGHLPLALDLVGSYAAAAGMTLPRFLEVHSKFDRKFIFQDPTNLCWDAKAYQRSLNNTFTFNFDYMDPVSRLLIDIVAFLDPDGVPTALFHPKSRERK